jgi:predicted Zn-dependent protease
VSLKVRQFLNVSAFLALSLSTSVTMLVPCASVDAAESLQNPIIETMKAELNRTMARLKTAGKAPLYYLAYRLYDCPWDTISASNGALLNDVSGCTRMLSVDMRVGSPHFDNTHFLRVKNSAAPQVYEKSSKLDSVLPGEGSGLPLQQALWIKSDSAFKDAQQRYSELVANNDVMSAEEDKSDDFSFQPKRIQSNAAKELRIDRALWEGRMRRLSRFFVGHPSLLPNSRISFVTEPFTRYFVNSEGSEEIEQHLSYRVYIHVSCLAKDGMGLWLWDSVESPDPELLPDESALSQRVVALIEKLEKLRVAPVAEPYVGPAILSGKAAAVFYHETFGHRIEAVHEKSENEGKTFSRKLGTKVMPNFLSVIDDPTQVKAQGKYLNGHYVLDDEGVPGRAVTLAKNGVLTGYLVSRSLVQGANASNGHGRSSPGWNPVARQANLFVVADKEKQVSPRMLRTMLIAEARKQHKDYGLLFDEIAGGATYTTSGSEQTYSINPLIVYKVFVDGRPDELIRGSQIVGTPLSALEHVIAAGNDAAVFNGECGRESGPVPVSAISPSLLLQSLETKRSPKTFDKLPILPDPALSAGIENRMK